MGRRVGIVGRASALAVSLSSRSMSFARLSALTATAAVVLAATTGAVAARGGMRTPAHAASAPAQRAQTQARDRQTQARGVQTQASGAPIQAREARAAPSRAAVRAALRRAEHSRHLWATVNVCEPTKRRVGIRGQIPALGFASRMRMVVRFGYYPRPGSRLRAIHAAILAVGVGTHASGLYQRGAVFTFKTARPVTISGWITFEWFIGRRLLGSSRRAARGGVRNVRDAHPRGESAARCRIR